ncbi:AraC family transcriptional regulator [Cohnella cellulosilytica]
MRRSDTFLEVEVNRMNWDDHIELWHRANVRILDIRRKTMRFGETLRAYRLPASGFLYTTRGGARIGLDGTEYLTERFHILHGGKGMCLDIEPLGELLEYDLILYKATLPDPHRREIQSLLERENPFSIQYGFVPGHPLVLYDRVKQMELYWRQSAALEKLQARGILYQFIYELLRQLQAQNISAVKPDIVSQVRRYIDERYTDPLTLDDLAQLFNYSARNLSRLFKQRTGYSLIDYTIRLRMDQAQAMLVGTEAAIQEIAEQVGYKDRMYFNRIFKKHVGISPGRYRESGQSRTDRPIPLSRSSIVPAAALRYTRTDNHYQYKRSREGELSMYRSAKPSLAAVMLLCVALLLGACQTASTNGGSQTPANSISGPTAAENGSAQTQNGSVVNGTETVTYAAVNGEVQIPKNPQRIVAVAGAYVGHLLALGIQPVGAGGEAFDNNYINGQLGEVENIGEDASLEKILELEPDLIIVWNEPEYIANLSKIAPTVAIDYGTPVREQMREFGKMTGREAQAEAWIAAWDRKIDEYKPEITAALADKTVSVFDASSAKEVYAYGNLGRAGDILYREFQLKAPPIIQKEAIDSGQGWARLSLEMLPEYAGDYIFISGWTGNADPEAVFEGPIWDNLPAVKNNRVFRNDGRGFVYSDPLSLEAQLEFVVDSLLP